MRFAVELSWQNVERGTGGTFGAAIFERESGRLIAPGVNLVVGSGCSVFHAEMVAILVAQRIVGGFDLGAGGGLYELVASTEPCVMCLGAVPWYGVRSLLCGACGEDAEEIGFDERTKPDQWVRSLEKRGIVVTRRATQRGRVGAPRVCQTRRRDLQPPAGWLIRPRFESPYF